MRDNRSLRGYGMLSMALAWLLLTTAPARADQLVAGGPGAQNQPSVAVSPLNPLNVVVAFQDYSGGDSACALTASLDGGRTWGPKVVLPSQGFGVGASPRVAFRQDGIGVVSCQRFNRNTMTNQIDVTRFSVESGANEAPATVGTAEAPGSPRPRLSLDLPGVQVIVKGTGASDFNSRAALATDLGNLSVYLTWVRFGGASTTLNLSRSTDGAKTWSTQPTIPGTIPGANLSLPYVIVFPDGGVFIAAIEQFLPCQTNVPFSTSCAFSGFLSTNGGTTFQAFRLFNINTVPSPLPGFNFQILSPPYISANPTGVDFTWTGFANGQANVYFSRCEGINPPVCGPAVRVNTNPAGDGRHSFFPTPTLTSADGKVLSVGYYQSLSGNPPLLDVYLGRSYNDGATWTTERVTTVSSSPNTGEFQNNSSIGDQLAGVVGSTLTLAWSDFRDGTQDLRIDVRPANPKELETGVGIDKAVVRPGESITLSAGIVNPPEAPPVTGNVYFGFLHPDRKTVTFFTNLSGGQARGDLSDPTTWAPIASNITIPPGTNAVYRDALAVPFGSLSEPGVYTAFLVVQGATGIEADAKAFEFKK